MLELADKPFSSRVLTTVCVLVGNRGICWCSNCQLNTNLIADPDGTKAFVSA